MAAHPLRAKENRLLPKHGGVNVDIPFLFLVLLLLGIGLAMLYSASYAQSAYDTGKKITIFVEAYGYERANNQTIERELKLEIPVTNDHNDVCSVDRATVRAVGENLLHFHVEYTKSKGYKAVYD